MSKSRLLAGVALAALCIPIAALSPALPFGVSAAQAQQANVSFQLFFNDLEPHGIWVHHAKYNYVFCPTGVDASWRPYTRGHWLYVKDRGWYFASDEPFAWATYHYGRWFADQRLGWCWVPGTKWAPAWVSWRRSDTVVGWAPLPPETDGYAVSLEVSRRELPEPYWVFVPTERFVEPDLSVNIVIGRQQPDYYAQTQFLGPVTVEGDVVINNVIDVTYIEQTINQQVTVYQPEAAADPAAQAIDVDAKAITVFDQDVAEPAAEAAPPKPVEEAEAAATIESKGGTAGATTDLPDEVGTTTDAPAPGASAQPSEPAATQEVPAPKAEQPAAEQPSAQEAAPSEDAAAPSKSNDGQAPAPEAPAETKAPPTADQPAAEDSSAQPAEGNPEVCAPDAMVDGKCPPAADQSAAAPDAEAQKPEKPAPKSETAPAPADPAPDASPAPETAAPAEPAPEVAPAPDAEAPPADKRTPTENAAPEATTPEGALACPPETMVDGKCPAVPAEPAE